ncbi:MAG: DM13 domain-containing protein [Thermoplasmatota archaeon]
MERKWLWIGIGALVVVGLVLAAPKFLPKGEVQLDQARPEGSADDAAIDVVRGGDWIDGDSAHKASGRIDIVTVDGDTFLRFTDFEMTAGPDVYLYLTPSADPQSTADVEGDGIRIAVKTDEDQDARLNERGTFFVPLDVPNLDAYGGVAAWCDDFNVLFGNAPLT